MSNFILRDKFGKQYKFKDADEIHRGGEGRIMVIASNSKKVAKIYHYDIIPISIDQYNFISKLDKSLFVVPEDLLWNENNLIVGFTMQYLGKDYFPLSTIFSKNFCTKNQIDETQKRKIASSLISALVYAHNNKIVVGDLNQYNIMINLQGDVKFIDVDSYETPGHKHTGILLDDIRDYLHGGKVTINSDFFALSVMLFYTLTYTHPFKGIHKKIKKISDRMINRIPVFANDPELLLPKCYFPLADASLREQYNRLYLDGDRFLVSLDKVYTIAGKRVSKKLPVQKIVQKDIIITPIVKDIQVRDIFFNTQQGYVETNENFIIFSTKNKGYVSKKYTLSKKQFDAVFVGEKNIIGLKNNKLYHYINDSQIIEIKNFDFPKEPIVQQFGNILIVVANDIMSYLYLDEIINTSIKNERTDVFSKGFSFYTGLIQNAGGVQRIFYKPGNNIANVKVNIRIRQIYQQGNAGVVQLAENNEVRNYYFKIRGLDFELAKKSCLNFSDFAYMPTDSENGFIFEPSDNKIKVIRTNDFGHISDIDCEFITEHSKLQYTKSGIIAWDDAGVFLLNKR